MHPNRETRQVGYQDYPTVAVRLVCHVLPFQYQPEHHRREQRRVGVDLPLDRAEPECVAERVCQCTHHTSPDDCHRLLSRRCRPFLAEEPPHQVGNRPEEEQDTPRTQQCRHHIHHPCHLRRIARKLREEVRRQHEERSTGWMPHFQLVARSNKLRAVPETCRRLNRQPVRHRRHAERYPSRNVVDR